MRPLSRRTNRLTVALPATLTRDIPHLREKTARIGFALRSMTMFRVDSITIYMDMPGKESEVEGALFEKILRFHETPQYLRRYLFKKDPDLQFAGVLPPLRTATHPDLTSAEVGQLREGVVLTSGSSSEVYAGFEKQVKVKSRLPHMRRVTIKITRVEPRFEGEMVDLNGLTIYWRPEIRRANQTLGQVVRAGKHDLTISTSRKGTPVGQVIPQLQNHWRSATRTLLMFGSPREGVPEILGKDHIKTSDLVFNLNTIPNQAVETVRTEEALHATLAILNTLEEA